MCFLFSHKRKINAMMQVSVIIRTCFRKLVPISIFCSVPSNHPKIGRKEEQLDLSINASLWYILKKYAGTYRNEIFQWFSVLLDKYVLDLTHIHFAARHNQSNETTVVRAETLHAFVQLFREETGSVLDALHCLNDTDCLIDQLDTHIEALRTPWNIRYTYRSRVNPS